MDSDMVCRLIIAICLVLLIGVVCFWRQIDKAESLILKVAVVLIKICLILFGGIMLYMGTSNACLTLGVVSLVLYLSMRREA